MASRDVLAILSVLSRTAVIAGLANQSGQAPDPVGDALVETDGVAGEARRARRPGAVSTEVIGSLSETRPANRALRMPLKRQL
ncbi:hypothetical protein ACH4CE_33370 [Streptomyces gelaticus]|uniref:hypothetical protein n=1 Tax=Streptomyces gelaticus TaxID=285446 RepID=UPI0037B77D30